MATVGREGHRARLRQQYFDIGAEDISTRTLLELYISLTVPRRDVKELLYAVMNKFPTLTELFNASYDELMSVKHMQNATAMSILTLNEILKRSEKNESRLDKAIKRLIYARSIFENDYEHEGIAAVFMTGDLAVKDTITLHDFSLSNKSTVSKITNAAVQSNASSVYLVHFTSGNDAEMSEDIDFLCDLKYSLRQLNIEIIDYIILSGSNDIIMSQNEKLRLLLA